MFYIVLISILGLFFGSFLSVVIFRFPDFKSMTYGRSKCVKCNSQIRAYDLIPVVSYILLRGRCRKCGDRISPVYLGVELLTGSLFFLFAWRFGVSDMLPLYLFMALVISAVFIYDSIYMEIPDFFLWLLVVSALVITVFSGFNYWETLWGVLIAGGFLGALVTVSRERWMGSGDIFIGLAFGLMLGTYRSILFLFLSFSVGAVFGLLLMLIKGKNSKSEIAFAPFLIISGIISLIWGSQIVGWYLGLMTF